jgi:hypothetical protein
MICWLTAAQDRPMLLLRMRTRCAGDAHGQPALPEADTVLIGRMRLPYVPEKVLI